MANATTVADFDGQSQHHPAEGVDHDDAGTDRAGDRQFDRVDQPVAGMRRCTPRSADARSLQPWTIHSSAAASRATRPSTKNGAVGDRGRASSPSPRSPPAAATGWGGRWPGRRPIRRTHRGPSPTRSSRAPSVDGRQQGESDGGRDQPDRAERAAPG